MQNRLVAWPCPFRAWQLAAAARDSRFDEVLGIASIKPGTLLIRVWQGTTHRVMVLGRWLCLEWHRLWLALQHRQGDHRHELEWLAVLRAQTRRPQ
jgi:hypothetical protein